MAFTTQTIGNPDSAGTFITGVTQAASDDQNAAFTKFQTVVNNPNASAAQIAQAAAELGISLEIVKTLLKQADKPTSVYQAVVQSLQ